MRHTVWILIVLAGTGSGQWRRFGDEQRSIVSAPLSREMLVAHNEVRSQIGVTPLSWSEKLAALSQEWADLLVARQQFVHRPKSKYGENLFEISGANASAGQVVKAWASESKNYDHPANSCRSVCGHYTQIVWRDTKEVGCAVARGAGREVWVCNYSPPGNWIGKRPY
ncbi:MAG TPA: CAP domain-containing protein [Bryobacteraceae bacterium]|nr:CAP domain-containing protein [Bryobacteraceae bacterium]